MASVSLLWNTNMAAVTSCQIVRYQRPIGDDWWYNWKTFWTTVDCKTVGKEIGKAWCKSFTRAKGASVNASLPSLALRFQPRSRPFV